ncbi:hypothetical protein AXG93_3825s1010 [Marchantia polymorpha subsp. ruderalis]|uniref:PHD-type domain-containing protein n=1 Tax=Marchantia polymorpha subsp. ruderalis TaxID=1480154 RepID=A0A176W9H7_MARPO|nr:hypothetical protein AXG93_3825s1010 [Marchantia polymorpha subsp. ruderalis]
MPLPDVLDLYAEGEMLPVSLPKELAALKARSVLYCLCQKPYDEDRAMIACDRCGEWYHFSCINLPEPPSSDEDTDDVIRQECEQSGDFICPKCKELVNKRDPQKVTGATGSKTSYRNQALPQEIESGQKTVEGNPLGKPFYGLVRGKRSHRSSSRARGEVPHKWQSPLFQPGRHSGFESFILLMRSR